MSSKVTFSATMDKIFGTSSSLRVKYRVAGKFGYLYFPVYGLGPGPQFVFTTRLGPQFVLKALAPNFHLPALAPNLYLPALAYNFITILGSGPVNTNFGPGLVNTN